MERDIFIIIMHVAYYLTGNISEKPFILAGRSDHSGVYPLFFCLMVILEVYLYFG